MPVWALVLYVWLGRELLERSVNNFHLGDFFLTFRFGRLVYSMQVRQVEGALFVISVVLSSCVYSVVNDFHGVRPLNGVRVFVPRFVRWRK